MLSVTDIVIKDACILFDLLDLNLMEDFYQLELTVFTTPQVIGEIEDPEQLREINIYINNGKLIVDNAGDYDIILAMSNEIAGLSSTDCSVLEFAGRKTCVILSTDGGLRREAAKRNFTVRGVLWIIEELHTKQIITTEKAVEKLEKYPEINRRTPKKEIDGLIKKLTNTQ